MFGEQFGFDGSFADAFGGTALPFGSRLFRQQLHVFENDAVKSGFGKSIKNLLIADNFHNPVSDFFGKFDQRLIRGCLIFG